MSTQIDQCFFQFGRVPSRNFSEDCRPGDWELFHIAFPTPFPKRAKVRVIVTANNLEVDRGAQNSAVVGIAQKVTTTDFSLAARNSDCARGFAGFNWLAVAETPGTDEKPVNLHMGVVQPKSFNRDCRSGDWQSWGVNFTSSFKVEPVALLTASNLNVRGHNAAVVGIVRDPVNSGFTLAARNSDCAPGDCTFYYVAVAGDGGGNRDLVVDSGEVGAQSFASDCRTGDWKSWPIAFTESFLTPPIVLVTANDRDIKEGHNAAVVGIAQDVTTHGFTLAGRSSDCAPGQAGFFWVAVGCAKGCG